MQHKAGMSQYLFLTMDTGIQGFMPEHSEPESDTVFKTGTQYIHYVRN